MGSSVKKLPDSFLALWDRLTADGRISTEDLKTLNRAAAQTQDSDDDTVLGELQFQAEYPDETALHHFHERMRDKGLTHLEGLQVHYRDMSPVERVLYLPGIYVSVPQQDPIPSEPSAPSLRVPDNPRTRRLFSLHAGLPKFSTETNTRPWMTLNEGVGAPAYLRPPCWDAPEFSPR